MFIARRPQDDRLVERLDPGYWHPAYEAILAECTVPLTLVGEFIAHITYGAIVTGQRPPHVADGLPLIGQGALLPSGVDLEGSPDFARLAEAFTGAKGFTLKRAGDIKRILERAMEYEDGPCVINAMVEKTDNVFPMIPAGKPLEEILIREPSPSKKLDKPSGST